MSDEEYPSIDQAEHDLAWLFVNPNVTVSRRMYSSQLAGEYISAMGLMAFANLVEVVIATSVGKEDERVFMDIETSIKMKETH